MKNLINTNKYVLALPALLLVAVFTVAKPVFAQEYVDGGDGYTYIDGGSGTSYVDGGNGYTYVDGGNGYTYVDGGNGYTYTPTPTYAPAYIPSSNPVTVYSGGSDVTYYSSPDSYYYPVTPGVVYSGGAYGGTPASPSTYTSSGQTTVYSGSASGGNPSSGYTYYYPTNGTTVSNGAVYSGVPNQVLAYTDTRNPQLSSVYLSDVPYTGAGDVFKIILFALALISWSLFATFMILKRKAKTQLAEVVVSNGSAERKENEFATLLDSDSRDIASIEALARENKVLLSTDAASRLVKIERLNGVRASYILKNASKGEWTTLGEKDLEKYL